MSLNLTRSGLARSGLARQGGWAILDQGLSSGTNFAAGFLVARWLGPTEFGAFALAFSVWIVMVSLSKAMFVQPFVVAAAPMDEDGWRAEAKHAAGAVVALSIVASSVIAVAGAIAGLGTATGRSLLVLAVSLPALLLQDLWRDAAFSRRRARTAAANDAAFALAQAASIAVLALSGRLTAASSMAAWGIGALVGALVGLRQLGARPSLSRATLAWARNASRLGGWLSLSSGIYLAGNQVTFFAIAALAGRAALGGVQAMFNLIAGPARMLTYAAEAVALPAIARLRHQRGAHAARTMSIRYSVAFAGAVGVYGVVVIAGGRALVRIALGASYLPYVSLIVPIAVSLTAIAFASGASLGLRSAGVGKAVARSQAIGTGVKIAAIVVLVPTVGIGGALWASAIESILQAGVLWWHYIRQHEPPILTLVGTPRAAEEVAAS